MSQKERQRYHLLKMVIGGRVTLKETSSVIGISYRQAKRLKKRLKTLGAKGLIHGNRGRPSARELHPELATRIIALSRETYSAFNDTHFTEKLNEIEGITVSRDTVRRLRRANGIKAKRKRRPKRHFKRRPRKPQGKPMRVRPTLFTFWFYSLESLQFCQMCRSDPIVYF